MIQTDNLADAASGETVILVHGLGAKRLSMAPLRIRMSRRGYRANSWKYSSLSGSIEGHGLALRKQLIDSGHQSKIHIVAHSMGCIVARAALATGRIPNLGRAVFFAPPNRGTPVARQAAKLVGRICTPIAELSDDSESLVNALDHIKQIDVGVVAAKFDLLVPVANTHADHERDHIVLAATHNSLLFSRVAADVAVSFISTGRFDLPCVR